MKKKLMFVTTLMLFSFIGLMNVSATETDASTECTNNTVVVHYLRYDGDYDNVGIFTWKDGNTGDTDGLIEKSGTDDFGAYYEICVADDAGMTSDNGTADDESDDYKYIKIQATTNVKEIDGTWWASKDSITDDDGNMQVNISELADTDEMHVYFVQGGSGITYNTPDMKNVIVVYYDPAQSYDGWGIHTWDTGTDGTSPGWDSPVMPVTDSTSPIDNDIKVFNLEVGTGAGTSELGDDLIGFIMHSGNDKKFADNITIDTSSIADNGVGVVYYLAGQGSVFTDVKDFTDAAFSFEFEPMTRDEDGDLIGTYAPNPTSIKVEVTLDVVLQENIDDDNELEEVFDTSWFTLKQGDTVVDDAVVGYNSAKTSTKEFIITFENDYELDPTKTYTLYYDNTPYHTDEDGNVDTDKVYKDEIEVNLDREAPTIEVLDTEIEITQYEEFDFTVFPEYVARDSRDGTITQKVYVPEEKGILDTGKLGKQEITLAVVDAWGHSAETTFTFNVVEPESTVNWGLIIGLSAGVVVLGAVGFVVLRKNNAA